MKEYEMKFLVEEEKFYSLLQTITTRYQDAPVIQKTQNNYYYDTPDLELKKQKITMRVRETDGQYLLQEKRHGGAGSFQSDEREKALSALPFSLVWQGRVLDLQGKLETKRISIPLSDGLRADFDSNHYLGRSDYEIELEFSPAYYHQASRLAAHLSLDQPNPLSKSERFFRAKGRL